MSARLFPPTAFPGGYDAPPNGAPLAPLGPINWSPPPQPPVQESEGIPWGRYIDVLRRNLLLIIALVAAGTALGMVAAKRVRPIYDTQVTVWINAGSAQQSGPIRTGQLLPQTSWVDLLRSFAIVDSVVTSLRLNVFYAQPSDSALLANLQVLPNLRSGSYILRVDSTGSRYVLSTLREKDIALQKGAVGGSVGRRLGIAWVPNPELMRAGRTVQFTVVTPRSMSINLLGHMRASLPEDGQFLTITLSGTDPRRIAQTLNVWATQVAHTSRDLKKFHLVEFKKILGDQLGTSERELHGAEI